MIDQKLLKASLSPITDATDSVAVRETADVDTAIDAAPEMTENTPETRIKVDYIVYSVVPLYHVYSVLTHTPCIYDTAYI